jgi:hypothetical protein
MERSMEMILDAQDYETKIHLNQLQRTIEYAHLRCLSPTEIINKISDIDEKQDRSSCVTRLLELKLDESELSLLERTMTKLAQRSQEAPSTLRKKLDRTVLRLVRMLPSELAARFATPHLDHRSKTRRAWAYSALRKTQIPRGMAEKLVNVFRRSGDQEALELIARNAERVLEIDPEFLLANIADRYWRGRVVEALLVHRRPAALRLASRYPFEFAHAAGRTGDETLRVHLRELWHANSGDTEFLSIYAYALGKIGAKEELQTLKKFISQTWACTLQQEVSSSPRREEESNGVVVDLGRG